MKERVVLFLLFIIIIPFVSSVSIDMDSEIPKGETVIVSISGNFFDPITKEDIYFYRGHVRTSFDYDVAKIGENYYIYFQTTGKAENNYSINISGVRYFVGSSISDEQISKSFKIINETSDFSIEPGFTISEGNFSIKIQNLNEGQITVEMNSEIGQDVTLSSGEIKILNVHLEDISKTEVRMINLNTENTEYEIPCYVIFKGVTEEENEDDGGGEETDSEDDWECSFLDQLFGECNAEDSQDSEDKNADSEENEQDSSKNNEEDKIEEEEDSSDVDYEVVDEGSKTVAVKDGEVLSESATSKTCAQIKGEICSSGEVCQNATIYAKDAKCCISRCVKEETGLDTKTLGWVMLGLLFVVILFFFLSKFRKIKNKRDPLLGFRR